MKSLGTQTVHASDSTLQKDKHKTQDRPLNISADDLGRLAIVLEQNRPDDVETSDM